VLFDNGEVYFEDCGIATRSFTLADALEKRCLQGANIVGEEPSSFIACPDVEQVILGENFDEKRFKRKISEANNESNNALTKLSKRSKLDDVSSDMIDSHQFVSKAVESLLESQNWKALEELILKGQVSLVANRDLIPELMKQNKVELLYKCMKHVIDVSEVQMVTLLKYVLEKAPKKGLEALTKELEKYKSDDEARARQEKELKDWMNHLNAEQRGIAYFLFGIMCLQKNEVFFVQAAKRLSAEETTAVLYTITDILLFHQSKPGLKDQLVKNNFNDAACMLVPNIKHCTGFLALFLDSVFSTLVSHGVKSPSVAKLLLRLLVLCKRNINMSEEMQKMLYPLEYLVGKRSNLLPSKPLGDYALETIVL